MATYTESFLDQLRLVPSPPPTLSPFIRRGVFPDERGTVQTTFQITRSMPTTNLPAFTPILTTTTDVCEYNYNDVDVGFNALQFRPEQFQWRGPVICADNLYFDFQREKYLNAYLRALRKNVDITIDNRYKAIYDHYVPKAVAAPEITWTAPGTGFPGTGPTLSALARTSCQLTQPMLDDVAVELNEIGANMGAFEDSWIQDGPQGPLYLMDIGQAASKDLLTQVPETRVDWRFAEMGFGQEDSQILKRVGASRITGNFRHLVNLTPTRYNWVSGTGYVEVPTWIQDPAVTEGFGAIINPEWKAADFEAIRIINRDVMQDLIIPPIMSSGGMTKFGPRSYMGEWMFVAGAYKWATDCTDPEERYGRHFARFMHGMEPLRPEIGRLLIFKRCVQNNDCIQCTPGAT